MPKPYSILAAALAASGRSLSTATVVAPIDRRAIRPGVESEGRFADPESLGSFNLESPFTMDPFAQRAPASAGLSA